MCIRCGAMGRRALGMAGLATLAAGAAWAQPRPEDITPRTALDRLMAGNERYARGAMNERDFSAGRAERARGQAPYAAILGCADSRVVPELAFDEGPGRLFTVTVAGNFVNSDGMASFEFGAAVLGTRLILVLGHTSCGAVNATVRAVREGNDLPGSLAGLVRAMKPGIEATAREGGGDVELRAVEANVRHNVQVLRTASPVLTPLIQQGRLDVTGGVYDLATGRVRLL